MENAQEPQPLLEWFTDRYKDFGAALEFVTNRSQEGSQFQKGFSGIGGLLRCVADCLPAKHIDSEDESIFPHAYLSNALNLLLCFSRYKVDFVNLAELDEDEEDEFYDSDHSSDRSVQ